MRSPRRWDARATKGEAAEQAWQIGFARFSEYRQAHPDLAAEFDPPHFMAELPADFGATL